MSALENLIRQAMASGVACFTDRLRNGDLYEYPPSSNIADMLGDFPGTFIITRADLIKEAEDEIIARAV